MSRDTQPVAAFQENMSQLLYILKGHTPVPEPDSRKWAEWYERERKTCRVAFDQIGGVEISTVFLGVNHNLLHEQEKPHLFETLIRGGQDDGTLERYPTWQEAETGHAQWVERIESETARPKSANPR